MNNLYIKLFLFFLCIIVKIDNGNSTATLKSYKVDNYISYGTNTNGCPLSIGVVLDLGPDQVISFSDNIEKINDKFPKMYYYEGTQQIFKIQINDIPFGSNDKIGFTVTDTSNTSNIIIDLDKPFQCKKLEAPFNEISFIGDLYLVLNRFYGFNIKLPVLNDLDFSTSFLKCEFSFTEVCIISKFSQYYLFYGDGILESGMGLEKITIKIFDLFGGYKTIEFDNTIFSFSSLSSKMTSYSILPENNTQVFISPSGEITNKIQLQTTYSELNAIPILKDTTSNATTSGTLILGTPTSKVYYFYYFITNTIGYSVSNYLEVNSKVNNKFSFAYTAVQENQQLLPTIIPITSIIQSEEANNNLIFSMSFKVSILSNNLFASPVYVSDLGISNSTTPKYPYGYSKSSSNSYWEYNSDCYILPIDLQSGFSVQLDSIPYPGSVKFPNVTNLITFDDEGPILRSFKSEQLENNKFIITLNITDKGTGVLKLFGTQPSLEQYALEVLSAGDPNNGLYEILADGSSFTQNILVLTAYDHYGNQNLNGLSFYYTDLQYNTASPIMKDFTIDDITFFKFDRHTIDTSFDNLDLTLTVGFKGASEYSIVPYILVKYSDTRHGSNAYFGVYNSTSGMFDIKIKAQARESGKFSYTFKLSPLALYSQDLESLFPSEKVLLTTNYVDHFPPIITNFKSITDTNLTINFGEQVTIGWEIEIYDYPVGLDYGIIQVVSELDFEPRIFTIKPDLSIPSSDIKSNYTISFDIKPYVNHIYYISSIDLYDKNGYYSQYPPTRNYLDGFNSFYSNQFISQQKIRVSIMNLTDQDTEAPELLSLSFPQVFDSFSTDRIVVFNFSLKDVGSSGISLRHNPYIHIQLLYAFQYKTQSELIKVDNKTGIHYYGASIELEYGKLAYGSIVSIHGITDNSLNIASFTSRQLKDKDFPSTIVNSDSPFENRPPVILDYSTLSEDGGKLFIYGKEFTNTPLLYINKGDGFELLSNTTFKSNLAITAQIPSVKGYGSIQFKIISKNNLESNIITIKPIINPIVKDSNCTLLNNCSGKGECIDSKCICISGFTGPDCSSTSKDTDSKPNDTPSISIFGTMIVINELNEININGDIIYTYPLLVWEGTTIQSQYQPNRDAYRYTTRLNGTENTNITITVDIFDQDTTVQFASKTLYMDKGTIKYTISINSYPFSSRFNTLQLKVNASLSAQDARCKLNTIGLSQDSDNIEWLKLRSDNKSIYGKFIQSAEVDYRLLDVQNKLLVAPTTENQNAIIGIQIPYYFEQVICDPDFSVIFDVDDLGKNKDATCIEGESKSGLSNSKIITISVICGVVGLTIVIASVILFFKKKANAKFQKKLKNLNQS